MEIAKFVLTIVFSVVSCSIILGSCINSKIDAKPTREEFIMVQKKVENSVSREEMVYIHESLQRIETDVREIRNRK